MTVVNTKIVNGVYVPESIEMDPYSEFEYVAENAQHEEQQQQEQPVAQSLQQTTATIKSDVDNFFDGVDMILGLLDHTHKRFVGGHHARRRPRNK
jgi:hypothetical protein